MFGWLLRKRPRRTRRPRRRRGCLTWLFWLVAALALLLLLALLFGGWRKGSQVGLGRPHAVPVAVSGPVAAPYQP